ncbi:MAG: RidA family protein [Actinobacteria bacterium]|nr:RidA family protein [Actinomycetota bacterium]
MATQREVARFGPMAPFVPNAVKVGDTIYLSGMVSIDERGRALAEGDLHGQCRHAYGHVRMTLEHFGATMADIVDETVFVTDIATTMREMEELWRVRKEAYGCEPQAAQAVVEVRSLASPKFLIEIKCVAVV